MTAEAGSSRPGARSPRLRNGLPGDRFPFAMVLEAGERIANELDLPDCAHAAP